MAKTIRGNTIIEDNHLANAISDAEALKKAYQDIDKVILKIKADTKGVSSIGGSVSEMKALTDAYKLSNDAAKASIQINKQLKDAEDEVVKGKIRLQQATATQKKLLTEEIALENKQIGTLEKLAIENKKLTRERQTLNLETKKGADRLKEINLQLDKNNLAIRNSSDAMGKQRLNIGNYQGAVNKLTSALGQLGLAFSVFTIMKDAATTIVDFEKANASLSAITGATGDDLKDLQGKVADLATEMKVSATETTKLFEIVGSQMPQLLKDAEGLQAVSKSAIILSKASGDSLEESTKSLTNALNQFGLGADSAERVMNVLAAGSLVGSAGIGDVSEAMKNFGSVAAGANISVEESVALIEVLGKFGVKGAESGTKLRGSILKLQQANFGYASGQFEVNDALADAKAKMESLGTQMEKDAFLQKTFGAENISTGRILLSNTKLFEEYTKGVTNTNTATEQAAINSDTLSVVVQELKAAWENLVIKWSEGTGVLDGVKTLLRFVADNLETIVQVILTAVQVWGVYTIAVKGVVAVNKLLGTSLKSNPFGIILSALTLIIPKIYQMIEGMGETVKHTKVLEEVSGKVAKRLAEESAEMQVLFMRLRATNPESQERLDLINEINSTYGTTLQNLSDETAFVDQLRKAYAGLIGELKKKIEAQVVEETILENIKRINELKLRAAELQKQKDSGDMAVAIEYQKALGEINSLVERNRQLFLRFGGLQEKAVTQVDNVTESFKGTRNSVKDTTKEVEKLDESIKKLAGQDVVKLEGIDVSGFDPKDNFILDAMVQAQKKIIEEEQKAAERRRKLAQESIALMKKITDALVVEIDKRIAKENEQLAESEKREDYFRELAKTGDLDAAESVKAEQVAQAKQRLEIEALEKKKRNLLILVTTLELASQKINSGDGNAISNAGKEIANLIASLPKFYEGTEGTVAEALGKPQLSGKDGYIVRVDGSEKVLNPAQSAMTGTMTTDEIARASLMYRKNQSFSTSVSQEGLIASKLDSVEKAIKNIPIPNFLYDEVNKMATHTIKMGNKTIKNHYKTGGLFS